MSRPQNDRIVEHSSDGGRTWTLVVAVPGSLVYTTRLPWHDGYGNSYREPQS
jgi:hypothetical protein